MFNTAVKQLSDMMADVFKDGGYFECRVSSEEIISNLKGALIWMRDKLPVDARYAGILHAHSSDHICFRFRSVEAPEGITVFEMPAKLPPAPEVKVIECVK